MGRIYLDHAATTPLAPEARDAMLPWLSGPGNPSSLHWEGRRARHAVDEAREAVTQRLGVEFGEFVFTSSGTESANLAILGCALAGRPGARRKILFSSAEHHAVIETEDHLRALGFEVEKVQVDRYGRIELGDLEAKLGEDVLLVAAMHANNELGSLQPVRQIADRCHKHGVLYFCDAVQTFGQLDWTAGALGADLIGVSSHKVYGPQGSGGLFIRAGTPIKPLTVGGGQEREMRAGTENVAAIAGFGAAVLAFCDSQSHIREARDRFLSALPDAVRTVPAEVDCLPGHAHFRFPGVSAESMLIVLDRLGVAASSGAACSSGSLEPSHVLMAAGYTKAEASEGLRFTFGRDASPELADEAARRVREALRQVREHAR